MNLKLEREPSSRQGRCKSVHFLPTLHLTYLSSCLNCSPALATFKTSNHRYSQMVEILGSHPRLMVVVGEVAGWSPLAYLQQGAEAPTKTALADIHRRRLQPSVIHADSLLLEAGSTSLWRLLEQNLWV
jgi:hypothetical protein